MDFGGGSIPENEDKNFLLRMFNRRVPTGRRKYWEHHHSYFEITLFKQGMGTYVVGGKKRYDIRPGDVFLFSSHEVHCITDIDTGSDMVLMNLHFQPRFVWPGGSDTFDSEYLKIFFQRSASFENRLPRGSAAAQEIAGILLDTENIFKTAEPHYELYVKINVLKILSAAIKKLDFVTENGEDYTLQNRHMGEIERALEFIDGNIAEDISLDVLCKKANMSRSYFSTVFKKICGISPWDYIAIKRAELAQRYLHENGGRTMLEIAYLCGFNSTANFNRTFKNITGKTPTEYKNEIVN